MRAEHAAACRHALALLLLPALLVVVGLMVASGGDRDPDRTQFFALSLQALVCVFAAMLFLLAWRIGGLPAFGWVSAASLFVGLQAFPFVLTAFSDPSVDTGRQVMALPVTAVFTLFMALARGQVTRGLHPVALGTGAAVAMVALRLTILQTDVLPPEWADGTAWLPRVLAVVLTVVALRLLVTNHSLDRQLRVALGCSVLVIGVVSAVAVATTEPITLPQALVTTVLVCTVAVLLMDTAIRALVESLDQHQDEMERLARAALNAEAQASHDQELLHEIRSTVGGLATASLLLARRDGVTARQRASLQRAMNEELHRVNRSVTDALALRQEFKLFSVVGPLLDVHRADGREVRLAADCPDPTVDHVPDAVVQVLGTLLHNAGRHAPGRPLTLTVAASLEGDHVEVTLSHPGPPVDPAVRAALFQRGVHSPRSPGQGLGLSVARRLMREHDGDLALTASAADLTSFTMTLPNANGRPAP